MSRFLTARRLEARDKYDRYYALHPEAGMPRKRREQHFINEATGIRFRILDVVGRTLRYTLPRGEDFALRTLLREGERFVLRPTARLQKALPGAKDITVVIESCGILEPRRKTGHFVVSSWDEELMARVVNAY